MPPGIAVPLLLSQVHNTAPFLFEEDGGPPYAALLRRWKADPVPEPPLLDYFRLCMSAHWATAGTFIPTDVDIGIRWKLWNQPESEAVRGEMADLVCKSLAWDYRPFTARRVVLPDGSSLATHEGTWFSVAAGAYAAARTADSQRAERLLEQIAEEVRREAGALTALREAGDALAFLAAVALVAHNLGDLDRIIDMSELTLDDPLRRRVYKAGRPGAAEYHPLFALVQELNTAHLASENHRHLALRRAGGLRRRREYLLPVGPFYDAWGAALADPRRGGLEPPALGEAVSALLDGFGRGVSSAGYPRALAGILEAVPGGFTALAKHLPARDARVMSSGALRQAVSVPRARFEARWAKLARL